MISGRAPGSSGDGGGGSGIPHKSAPAPAVGAFIDSVRVEFAQLGLLGTIAIVAVAIAIAIILMWYWRS